MAYSPLYGPSPRAARGRTAHWLRPVLGVCAIFLLVGFLVRSLALVSLLSDVSLSRDQYTIYDKAMAIQDPIERVSYLGATSFNRICFMHVPKTGGTNLAATGAWKSLFETDVFSKKLQALGEQAALVRLNAQSLARSQTEFSNFGHTQDPQGCMNGKVVTLIRDPMERMVSAYRNSKKTAETCDLDATDWSASFGSEAYALTCDCCGVLSFRELVVKFREEDLGLLGFLVEDHMPRNQMTKQLLGWSIANYCDETDPELYEARLQMCRDMIRTHLLEHFILVGFSEYYESIKTKFIDLFDVEYASVADEGQVLWEGRKAIIGASDFAGLPQVVSTLGEEERARLLEWTRVDRILYEEAMKLWEAKHAGTEPWL